MKEKWLIGITVIIGIAVGAGLIFIWLNQPSTTQGIEANLSPVIETGRVLYAANCLSCHGDRQAKPAFGQAPPHNGDGHTWHHSDAELIQWILEGRPFNMPAFGDTLSREDAEAILAYIKTWWTPQQRATQADISRRYQEALDRQNENN